MLTNKGVTNAQTLSARSLPSLNDSKLIQECTQLVHQDNLPSMRVGVDVMEVTIWQSSAWQSHWFTNGRQVLTSGTIKSMGSHPN